MLRQFHVVAIPIRIVVNSFGDHDPNGMMYVLKENEATVRQQVEDNPLTPVDLVQPLIIRANVGDEVEIVFENQLPFNTSMHIQKADYNVYTSDGAFVGNNVNTTVAPSETIIYKWHIHQEGIHIFTDLGNTLASEKGSNLHGLFGTLIAEAKGSSWTDPVTGETLKSGLYADIHHPILPSFREYAWFFHDEMAVVDKDGQPPINPMTNEPDSTHTISYRAEPARNRVRLIMEGVVCPGCEGEEVHHDSWPFGDPATPILMAYVGDPVKIRLIHGGVKETHVFHYHVHQWFLDLNDPDSDIIDSQSISPQTAFTISPLYGAGSLQGAFGDVIIHCHLYPHFDEGMWGMQRIFNTLQDGTQTYPNGEPILALQPLPDRTPPPLPTPDRPGFPNFIPGILGQKAPRPPLGIIGGRDPTQLELDQFAPNARPGAVFVNPCTEETPEREFNIVGIQMPIEYNREGWHDPEGRLYVLAEDEEAILSGEKPPEPLTIRANAGECIRINFTNKFPEFIGGNAFQVLTRTYEASTHIHFVKFDVLVSDGANVGWNYDSSCLNGETIRFQWYADVELGSAFFHDHLFANSQQQHGVFATITIEPKGSIFLSPQTGEEITSGTQAIIENPLIPDFREFTLFVQDFTFLFDTEGNPLNPPPFPGSPEDPGVMGFNYRNEPLQFREGDSAYVFSSFVHGDPITPILETYNGDPVRIRLLQGTHEESHIFNLHRQRWHKQNANVNSELTQEQHIGISESFTLSFNVEGSGDFDMLYTFGSIIDLWLGNWGILRSFQEQVPHLIPLNDRNPPPPRTSPLPIPTGEPPPKATSPGEPCPDNIFTRHFDVVALNTKISYNAANDNDPFGIVFALTKDEEAIKEGLLNPEPLIIRGNVGECIEVTLHNKMTQQIPQDILAGYPGAPVPAAFPASLRISLHTQLLAYDVLGSDGSTVGFNPDQTIAPGESITYRWYVDQNVGVCNLWDVADLINHRHHGSFGIFIAEPKGSIFLDPVTREETNSGDQVIISNPLLGEFREFVIIMHDGIRLVDNEENLIVDPDVIEEAEDFEDQGSRGFNYRSERFGNRLKENPEVFEVFSSTVHGDPATPIFLAYKGDPITVRLAAPADRPRARSFTLHGHNWQRDENNVNSDMVGSEGEFSVGSRNNILVNYGAGSFFEIPGDYMYRSGDIRWDIELGMWGILRVLEEPTEELAPLRTK